MSSYSSIVKKINKTGTSTGQRVPRKGHKNIMIKNAAGGFTYTISDEDLIDRILILGTSSNTYYSSAESLTETSIGQIKRIIDSGKGQMIVDHVKNIYESGRAPKQDPTFFVLSLLTQSDVPLDVRKSALQIVSGLRTFTQLYSWISLKKQLADGHKGFGRATRSALLELFKNKTGQQLVYQCTKYNSRKIGNDTWTIADVIACAHIPSKVLSPDSQIAVAYMVKGLQVAQTVADRFVGNEECLNVMQYLNAVEAVKAADCTTDTAIQLIRQFKLPREVLSTHLLNSLDVWKALLYTNQVGEGGVVTKRITMPITALIRNLGVMSSKGIFNDDSLTQSVCSYLTNYTVLRSGRVHPVAILVAKLTYQTGRGLKGKLNWPVNKYITEALENAFYVAFGHIEGTGKRIYHAVDCSGSMSSATCALPNITACQAVSTLVMEAVRRENKWHQAKLAKGENSEYVQDIVLFNSTSTELTVSPDERLDSVMKKVQANNFGTTDCAQPMIRALQKFKSSNGKTGLYDLFVVYTDNETYYGTKHPSEALDEYRKTTGIDAKLVVIATTPTSNSIGFFRHGNASDKDDSPACLNIAGFDLNAPTLIKNFAQGSSTASNSDANTDAEEYEIVEDI